MASFGFYLDNGNDAPGALFGNLQSPNPGSGTSQYMLLPDGLLRLEASTKYWLVASASAGDGFDWVGSVPTDVPTSGFGLTYGKQISITNGVPSDVTDGSISTFKIVSTIPEPATGLLLLAAMSVLVGVGLRSSTQSRRLP